MFWYVKERMMPGPVFGSKDYFSGLAVIIDTYNNHDPSHFDHSLEHPYISVLVCNGVTKYDHDQDGTHQQAGGCGAKSIRNAKFGTRVGIQLIA